MSVATLPMYDWPEVRDATDAFWAALSARLTEAGVSAPDALDRARPEAETWADATLLFSQACGMDHVAGAARATRVIATPVYESEGCGGGRYSSAFVARKGAADDLLRAAAPFAANSEGSLSGWVAPALHLGAGAIGDVIWTGSHRASVVAVAEGKADLAAIDAVAWDLARRFEPAAEELAVIGWTDQLPAPPFVTSALTPSGVRAKLRAQLVETLVDPETEALRHELRLARIVAFADTDYDPVREAIIAQRAL